MANKVGKLGSVDIEGNIVAELKSWSVNETASVIDDSELSDDAESTIIDKTKWVGSLEAHWDPADTVSQGAMSIGSQVTVIFNYAGLASGDTIATGTANIIGKTKEGSIGSMISANFELDGVGALIESIVP